MHSTLVRLQNVFGFFTTVAFFVGGLAALSVFLTPGSPTASVRMADVQVVRGRPHYYSTKKEEYAHIKFDLDADFSSLFTWNTKQLFVYVLVAYPTTSPSSTAKTPIQFTESILWDTIISAPESPYSFTNLKEKYFPAKEDLRRARSSSTSKSKSKPKGKKESKPGVLKLKNQKPKYQISDFSGKIGEVQNVTLTVGWNIQPWVGALQFDGWSVSDWEGGSKKRSQAFAFPAVKGAKKSTTEGTGDASASVKASASAEAGAGSS